MSLAHGQEAALTLEDVLARARAEAPFILAARARAGEASARVLGASLVLRENPEVEVEGGPRLNGDETSLDLGVEVTQPVEIGGRRPARLARAKAGLTGATARGEEATRRLLQRVATAFWEVVAGEELHRLATEAERLAADLQRVAERKYHAGEVPVLDLNLARAAAARGRAEVRGAAATQMAALGRLRIWLGMRADEPLAVRGDLRERRRYVVETLLAAAPERADLRQLAAEIRAAEADLDLGRAAAWPQLALGARYERDEDADIALGVVRLTLPVFARGQQRQAAAAARAQRLRLLHDAGVRAAAVEIRTALAVYREQVAAVEALEREALPSLDENETLLMRSYEAGEIGLTEVILIRQDALQGKYILA